MSSEVGSFQILEIPQNVSRKNRILGGVVPSNFCTNPFDNYAPYWDHPRWATNQAELETLKEAIDFFWKPLTENGVQLRNVIANRGRGSQDEVAVKATLALQAYANKVVNEDVKIEAGEVEEYTIDNPSGAVATRLNECTPWMEEVKRLCSTDTRTRPTYYIVTGVYTCKNMIVGWNKEDASGRGLAAQLPGEALAAAANSVAPGTGGAAKVLESSVKYQHVKETDTEISAQIDQEIIFALRYHKLNIIYEDEPQQRQAGMLARLSHRMFGKPDSSAEPTPRGIKSVSLGDAVRDVGMISSYGQGEEFENLFYWEEPNYILPDLPHSNGATH